VDVEKVLWMVKEFQNAIIKAKPFLRFPYNDFPEGCCQDTSWILYRYFLEQGIEGITLISGSDYTNVVPQSHSWLEFNDYIIDLTYYQFGDKYEKVIFTKDRTLHKRFNREFRKYHKPYFEVFPGTCTNRARFIF
jgi:hypothetical protein